jgi:hypothetical protein
MPQNATRHWHVLPVPCSPFSSWVAALPAFLPDTLEEAKPSSATRVLLVCWQPWLSPNASASSSLVRLKWKAKVWLW